MLFRSEQALDLCEALADAYHAWITDQESDAADPDEVPVIQPS